MDGMFKSYYQVIMLSRSSKGCNPIPIMSYDCGVILHVFVCWDS